MPKNGTEGDDTEAARPVPAMPAERADTGRGRTRPLPGALFTVREGQKAGGFILHGNLLREWKPWWRWPARVALTPAAVAGDIVLTPAFAAVAGLILVDVL